MSPWLIREMIQSKYRGREISRIYYSLYREIVPPISSLSRNWDFKIFLKFSFRDTSWWKVFFPMRELVKYSRAEYLRFSKFFLCFYTYLSSLSGWFFFIRLIFALSRDWLNIADLFLFIIQKSNSLTLTSFHCRFRVRQFFTRVV